LKKIYKKDIEDIIFIFEPIGSYSEGLRKYCSEKLIKCFIINPKQFSSYAKALGEEVKNDINDARVLSKALNLAKDGLQFILFPRFQRLVLLSIEEYSLWLFLVLFKMIKILKLFMSV
jgi:transposase